MRIEDISDFKLMLYSVFEDHEAYIYEAVKSENVWESTKNVGVTKKNA